ncbi:sugar ABC transporter ATP-binding protein [Cohnella faecalis]|uniref:sugar ABC transporter ATP-binding protein n=1 Tax=Cohnella faecalis TaxID=2315694 RepID=UPI0011C222F7|nr:sugar ABC transporter ATP-binding protein [Cohnella faecalis]
MSDTLLLHVEGLGKHYNGNRAIENINLRLPKGIVHALIGENGAGKSTLIKLLTGLVRPSAGTIVWKEKEVIFKSPQSAIQEGIVAVHQELTLVDTLTVCENIWLGREPRTRLGTIDFAAMERESKRLMQELDIHIPTGEKVKHLSIADKQLVELIKAIAHDPQLLILDEATSTLGEKEVDKIYQVVLKFKQQGKSVLFVSHRMKEIFQFCDTCSIFKDGMHVTDGLIGDLTSSRIIEYMTGRDISQTYPPKLKDMDPVNKERFNTGPILEVKGLFTRSGLQNVNLSLYPGEIVGIGGLQGHGQSELIQALFGLEQITEGSIAVNGRSVKLNKPLSAIREGIQLVPQDRKTEGLFVELDVAENLIPCSLDRISKGPVLNRRAKTQAVKAMIEKLSIKVASETQVVKLLSGGNQQKIALGKWLLKDAKVLMLIEPTRGIDIKTKMEISALLRKLASEGYGVIVSTNEMNELIGLSDRVLIMFEKQTVNELKDGDITEQNILNAAFGKRGMAYEQR